MNGSENRNIPPKRRKGADPLPSRRRKESAGSQLPRPAKRMGEAAGPSPESGADLSVQKKKSKWRLIILVLSALLLLAVLFIVSVILFPYYWSTILFDRYADSETGETAVSTQVPEEWPPSMDPVGWETLAFGRYEQDNIPENGPEEIEWIVLSQFESKQLLLSRYVLDCQPFNTKHREVTWESRTLRKWLNEAFLQQAFSPEEQERILEVNVYSDQESWIAKPGREKEDRIFLLSAAEADQLFSAESERICLPSPYAVEQGVFKWELDQGSSCDWWLRTSGNDLSAAMLISYAGVVQKWGLDVDWDRIGVRPAIWVDLG